MSIHYRNGCRELLLRTFDLYGRPLRGMQMVEFGNQRLKFDPGEGARRLQAAKPYFEFLGIRHVAIDTNGKGGAIPLDLSQPIDWAAVRTEAGFGRGEADVVTNFGTSEHVKSNQFQVFANAHQACAFGGLMTHAVPAADSCRRHGFWKYTADWFRRLADAYGYQVEHLKEWDKTDLWGPQRVPPETEYYVLAIFRKIYQQETGRRFPEERWPGDPVRQR